MFDWIPDFEIGEIGLTESLENLVPGSEDSRDAEKYSPQPQTEVWDPFAGW